MEKREGSGPGPPATAAPALHLISLAVGALPLAGLEEVGDEGPSKVVRREAPDARASAATDASRVRPPLLELRPVVDEAACRDHGHRRETRRLTNEGL